MAFTYDLMLKGGEVVDPSQDLRGRRDVAFKDGRVAAVTQELPRTEAAQVIDVSGRLVTPGLLDIHGHFAYRFRPAWADPDPACLSFGVTTAVDAGSMGWANFPAFRTHIMERVDTRLYAFLHISTIGLVSLAAQIPDLQDFRLARAEEAVQCIEGNRDLLLGIKVRLSPNGTTLANAVPALEMARHIADRTGSLMMVHVMESPIALSQVFRYLHPGDIATHIFHGDTHNVLDEGGRVRPEVWQAYEQGVVFDTACASRHFALPVCRAVIEQGLLPHTISTDRIGPRPNFISYNLLDIMSIFLALGMSLEQVVRCVTVNAASAIGRKELGTLRVGAAGDAAVLELEQGDFGFTDMLGNDLRTEQRFAPVMTVKGGKRWRPR